MLKTTKVAIALGVVAGLGVAALPLSSYAVSKDSTVKLKLEETLSLELTGNADTGSDTVVDLGTLEADGDVESANLTATVKTNSGTGYKLTLGDKDDNNNLVSGDHTIAAGTPASGKSAWGFKMGTISIAEGATQSATAVNDYIAVPVSGSDVTIVNSNKPSKVDETTPANSGDTAIITFGASANSAQAAGTYSDTVVVTASANA